MATLTRPLDERIGARPVRRPAVTTPSLPTDGGRVVGVDLGGTWVRAGQFAANGLIARRATEGTQHGGGPQLLVRQIGSLVREVSMPTLDAETGPMTVAIGVPGPVDPAAGVVHAASNLPGWYEVPLRQLLEANLGCRCLVEHDATLAALGEHRRGAGRGVANFAYITVSTGIGAGLILHNRIYRGGTGGSGEFGHVVVAPDGPLCDCGNRGCLDAVASGRAIARDAAAASTADVGFAAAAGDQFAQAVLDAAARHLGLALGGLVNLLNLEMIAVGGGVLGAGAHFWDRMVSGVAQGSFETVRQDCRIERAQLDDDQGLIGAFELASDILAEAASRSTGEPGVTPGDSVAQGHWPPE